MHFTNLLPVAALASSLVQAHPGHDIKQEIAERAAYLKLSTRSVGNCAAQLKARGHHARTIERRSEILRREREKRGLPTDPSFYKARSISSLDARDATTVLNTSHLSSTTYTPDTDVSTLFAGNNSCILVPEVTEGPYYVSGELIRSDVRDDQVGTGIELILDLEVIDTSTCDPISDVYVDFWHCNSTGVYSGVVASGNGNSADLSNINETHHRGLQPTSDDGVAQFITNYPGHYTGRTNHIHVATHFNGTVLANNTFSGSTVSHIGQIFFDQDLTTQVEATGNYATNTQDLTTNANDSIFTQEAALGDPVVEYSLLSDNIEDGIFAWIAFGIDVTSAETIQAAAVYGAGGGYSTGNSAGGGGSGGPGGAGGAPPTK